LRGFAPTRTTSLLCGAAAPLSTARRWFLPGTTDGIIRSPSASILPLAKAHASVHDLLAATADAKGDRVALVCGTTGRTRTFAETARRADEYARLLHHRFGVRAGDNVMLVSPNALDFLPIVQACWRLGAVVCPTNPLQTPAEMAKLIGAAGGVRLIVGHDMVAATVRQVEAILGPKGEVPSFCFHDGLELNAPAAPTPIHTPAADELICMPFSSGTSGVAKGVRLCDMNLRTNIFQTQERLQMVEEDVVMSVLPMFHIYGLTAQVLAAFVGGTKQVVIPRFDLQQYLELAQRHRATFLFTAPPMVLGFAKATAGHQYDLSTVRFVMSGAAPLGKELMALTRSIFPKARVTQGYGLTETSPAAHINIGGADGSVGAPCSDTEVRLVDVETGRDVDAFGQQGEIWIRGPQVMLGYVRPEDTAAALTPDGFFKTGDVGDVDENFDLFIRDRVKELIKVRGFQVAPAELEHVLLGHPFVHDAIVVGVATPTGDEAPKAHIVLNAAAVERAGLAGKHAEIEAALMAHMAQALSRYKQLTGGIRFVDAIPKSPTGKVLRRIVRDQERAEAAATAAAAPN
jgi:acyl-CoA synthetase (AMP-forming)/AMP-acid ligase II